MDCQASDTHLPNKGLDSTGTTVGLVKSDLTDDLVTELPGIASVAAMGPFRLLHNILAELLDLLDLGRQVVGEGVLEGLSKALVCQLRLKIEMGV